MADAPASSLTIDKSASWAFTVVSMNMIWSSVVGSSVSKGEMDAPASIFEPGCAVSLTVTRAIKSYDVVLKGSTSVLNAMTPEAPVTFEPSTRSQMAPAGNWIGSASGASGSILIDTVTFSESLG